MSEFKVGAHTYRAAKLTVFQELHVSRKVGSVLIYLGSMQKDAQIEASKERKESDPPPPAPPGPAEYARMIVSISSPISQENMDFAMATCLGAVSRKQAAIWSPIMAPTGGMMFQDISLLEMMEIFYHVLRGAGLVDFFFEALSDSNADRDQTDQK